MNLDASRAKEALYATARWLFDTERTREAADVFRAMVMCAPKDERAWLGLGVCHEHLEHTEVALEMYSVGQVAAAPAPRCALAMALLLRRLGNEEESQEVLESAALAAELSGDDELEAAIEQERRNS